MQELDTPTFRLAVAQFDQAAEAMRLDTNLRERLKLPQRSLVVSLPVRMDDGTIKVAAVDGKAGQAAIDWIRGIVAEPEVGVIYTGTVVKTMDFGAFVNFLGKRDGLVHISELAPKRVQTVGEVVKEGDVVKVKCLGIDDRGKVKLSMKRVDQATGADLEAGEAAAT